MSVLLALLFSLPFQTAASVPGLPELRQWFVQAANSAAYCRKLSNLSGEELTRMPVVKGYKAVGTMMMANHVMNPVSKLSYFRKGRNMLQEAIAADKDNIELTFLRFTIQTNIPSFLGYNDHISADKAMLLNKLNQVKEHSLQTLIGNYLVASKTLTVAERRQLTGFPKN